SYGQTAHFLFASSCLLRFSSMNGRTGFLIFIAAVLGLAAGFILANSINRSELSTLRAENERLKTAGGAGTTVDAKSALTDDEINATIAKADQSPNDFDTQRNIGVAIYRYGAMKQDEKLIRESVRILDRAAGLRPDDYDVTLSLANANFDVGYFTKDNDALAKARNFYSKALVSKPENVDVRTDLGLTYFLQNPPDFDNAINEFKKSLEKNPKHEKTLQFMVQTLVKQNKTSEASDYLERLRAVNPKNESIGELTSMLSGTQPAG
ncbi:MAG TPA: tetratricopeptide repeat protein, partial [Pyrinomonadaceae bacterium]|nr:tetratricopeptide repeat protein [Pyrinomonadaceae bacterium]